MGRFRDRLSRRRGARRLRRDGGITIYDDSPVGGYRTNPLTGERELASNRSGHLRGPNIQEKVDEYDLHRRRRTLEKHVEGLGADAGGGERGGRRIADFFGASARTNFEVPRERLAEIAAEYGVGITYLRHLTGELGSSGGHLRTLREEATEQAEQSAMKTAGAVAAMGEQKSTLRRRRRLQGLTDDGVEDVTGLLGRRSGGGLL